MTFILYFYLIINENSKQSVNHFINKSLTYVTRLYLRIVKYYTKAIALLTTFSIVKPNFSKSKSAGADAPKLSIPKTSSA